ncbi:hypothetical protein Efla_005321 [Eimeria flavescens]
MCEGAAAKREVSKLLLGFEPPTSSLSSAGEAAKMARLVRETVAAVKEGVVDFEAQQFIQTFLSYVSVAGTVVGFVGGLLLQSFSFCCLSVAVTAAITSLVCIPSWPIYKRHQIAWMPHDPQRLLSLYAGEGGAPCLDGQPAANQLAKQQRQQTSPSAAAAGGRSGSKKEKGAADARKRR